MKTYRAAVIGTGFIGPVHVEGLRRAGVEVAAIIGSTPQKSHETCQRLGMTCVHETLDDALNDSSIDAIHLATPNVLHYEQVKAVLSARKHCLCEKPLAMNSTQSAELVTLAKQSGVVAGVAYNIRFYPLCHESAAKVATGAIGDLISVTGSYVQDWLLYPKDFNWRVMAEDGGELRAVADIGTHWLDLIQYISAQKIVSVCADLRTVHEKRLRTTGKQQTFTDTLLAAAGPNKNEVQTVNITTEDCGAILIRFESGANGCLWVSQVTAGRKNALRFEMSCTQATLEWNSESPNQLWIGHRDRANELMIRDPALLQARAASISSYPGGHNEGFPDTFKQLFRSFYRYIDRNDSSMPPPFPTFADGHRELLLCEAILASHRQRCWVELKE